jgi:DNA repair exonuclease SbcCD ATPase subunit
MFPGADSTDPGLHIAFQPGITLILGANGLGKTTVVNVLFRLLTGPWDLPGIAHRTTLGTGTLEPKALNPYASAVFAGRVFDGAKKATATLEFTLHNSRIVVERRLTDLTLRRFAVDGEERPTSESEYQDAIARLVGLWGFGDWILALRHLIFYFEDRRALVWDPSAQRQILRFLFLSVESARRWTEEERRILELDSAVRNLNNVITRESRAINLAQAKLKSAPDIRAELRVLEQLQTNDLAQRETLNESFPDTAAQRASTRLRVLTVEQERESRFRDLERARLLAIEARFPTHAQSARYILAQLMTEGTCLVCGNTAPQAAAQFEDRIKERRCIVCDSDLSQEETPVLTSAASDRRVRHAATQLAEAEAQLLQAREDLASATDLYEQLVHQVAQLDAASTQRAARIQDLVALLPPEEAQVYQQRTDLSAMDGRLQAMRQDLEAKRGDFSAFLESINRDLVTQSNAITAAFHRYAEGFLLEQCILRWSPQHSRLGQSGELIAFPAFELDMSGVGFVTPVRRTGPEEVSESQREFIDLAFRMALMEVSATGGGGCLVMDAPESSLDAVFVSRAAKVLGRFADGGDDNRLVITSNLVEGQLIPDLLREKVPGSVNGRVVDLFTEAAPTAALQELRDEYRAALEQLWAKVRSAGNPLPSSTATRGGP